jgi:hypothetical protein
MPELSRFHVRQLFDLNEKTGELIWKKPTAPSIRKGDIAGCFHSSGFWQIHINGRWYHRSHLVYMYKYGGPFPSEIAHKDGNIANDRPENLRKILHFPKKITQETLQQAVWLDYATGEFYRWVEEQGRRVLEQTPIGTRDPENRCGIHMTGRRIMRSQLVYLYAHGGKLPDQVNHINNDPTDDRPNNLRAATVSQRNRARKGKLGKDLPKGVTQQSRECNKPFYARIFYGEKRWFLGSYETVEEAAAAYNIAANELFGEYARLNELGINQKLVTELLEDVLARIANLSKS